MDPATGAMASLLPKLGELLNEKYKLEGSTIEDVKFLSHKMGRMQAVLLKIAEVPPDQLNEQVNLWAADTVKQLSSDMEIVVDKLLALTPNTEGFKGLMEKIDSLLKKGKTRHQIIASRIKDMKTRVLLVEDLGEQCGVFDGLVYPAALVTIGPHLSGLYRNVTDLADIVGEKCEELMKFLSDGDNTSNKKLKIVCVVGLGGLGKTTLVRAVYDKINIDFDCSAFVSVGQSCNLKEFLKYIIAELSIYASHLNTLDTEMLIWKIREILQYKRFLIVIDDLWDENMWKHIRGAFPVENNLGSLIITTTRILKVSQLCCSSANDTVYHMKPLSDEDSRKLFCGRIFGSVNRCPHEFEQVSSDILKKCNGVPLAIMTMASVLAGHTWMKPKDEWHILLELMGISDIRTILSCSYNYLPPHLKTGLLYLSTFPRDYPLKRDRIMKKWIVEGIVSQEAKFIGSSNEEAKLCQELSLEEVARQYIDELVTRNVIHPLDCSRNGEVISYYIHPYMHEILRYITIEDKFGCSVEGRDISRARCMNFRYLSIYCSDSRNLTALSFDDDGQPSTIFGHAKRFLLRLLKCKRSSTAFDINVHSLTVLGHMDEVILGHFKGARGLDLEGCWSIEYEDVVVYICSMVLLKQLCLANTGIRWIPPQIGNLQCLEGLDVGGTRITELPPQIGNLQCLERLDVGGTQITELPQQIGKLQNLKTLDARKSRVKDLPDEVVLLTRLVHLLIGDNESCKGVKLPDGIGKLTSLQQLCTIDLRKCSASSLEELVELPCLKEIAVVASDELEDIKMKNALFYSLNKSIKKRSLVVYSDFRLSTPQSSSPDKYLNYWKKHTVLRFLKVPIGFAEQSFLIMLDIRVCKLEDDDLKILRWLPRLQSLIVRLEVLPTKMIHISCEGFAKLESFHVDCRMPRVIFEEGAMPKLEHLELKLYAGSASEEHMGMKHLRSLQKVILRYSKWYATNKGVSETTDGVKTEDKEQKNKGVKEITDAVKTGAKEHQKKGIKETIDSMKTEAKVHQNKIALCIVEEGKYGEFVMKTEIFEENKDDRYSKMTEIEDSGDNTQEGDLHQSSRDIASCSGASEIEEV